MLVTSREPLRLRTEWLFDLEGLDYPQSASVEDLESFDAVRMFVQRARQMQRRWVFAGDEAHAVARICQSGRRSAAGDRIGCIGDPRAIVPGDRA